MKVALLHQGDETLAGIDPIISNAIETKEDVMECLEGLGMECCDVFLDGRLDFIGKLKEERPDIVLNMCNIGEYEPHVAAILDWMGIPYTGSNYFSLSVTNNKALSKQIMLYHGIRVPRFYIIEGNPSADLDRMEYPVILKSPLEHDSLHISFDSIIYDGDQMRKRLGTRIENGTAYAEQYIEGREITAGFIGNERRKVLPIEEIVYGEYYRDKPKILTYEAKWDEDSLEYEQSAPSIPAKISKDLEERIREAVLKISKIFDIRDYGRVDFRVDANGEPYVIDVNANPDISRKGGLFKMASCAGMSYPDFIKGIMDCALERYSK
ncbi:MAG: hypothetical protein QW371_00870 [Candidatus Bathyarchaeia archaeon]